MKWEELTQQHLSNIYHKYKGVNPLLGTHVLGHLKARFGGKILSKGMETKKQANKSRRKEAGDKKKLQDPVYSLPVLYTHDLITVGDFIFFCERGSIKDGDGLAYPSRNNFFSPNQSIKASTRILLPDDATHVVWVADKCKL